MKDVYEVLRQKELELARLATEVEALRVAAPLLSDDKEVGNETQPISASSAARSLPLQVLRAVNDSPKPADPAEWADRAQGWP